MGFDSSEQRELGFTKDSNEPSSGQRRNALYDESEERTLSHPQDTTTGDDSKTTLLDESEYSENIVLDIDTFLRTPKVKSDDSSESSKQSSKDKKLSFLPYLDDDDDGLDEYIKAQRRPKPQQILSNIGHKPKPKGPKLKITKSPKHRLNPYASKNTSKPIYRTATPLFVNKDDKNPIFDGKKPLHRMSPLGSVDVDERSESPDDPKTETPEYLPDSRNPHIAEIRGPTHKYDPDLEERGRDTSSPILSSIKSNKSDVSLGPIPTFDDSDLSHSRLKTTSSAKTDQETTDFDSSEFLDEPSQGPLFNGESETINFMEESETENTPREIKAPSFPFKPPPYDPQKELKEMEEAATKAEAEKDDLKTEERESQMSESTPFSKRLMAKKRRIKEI